MESSVDIFEEQCDKKATIAAAYKQLEAAYRVLSSMKEDIEDFEDRTDNYRKALMAEDVDELDAINEADDLNDQFYNDVGLHPDDLTNLIEKIEDFYDWC